ncbi:MAG: hypothetical protein JSW08_03880 [archaeon]|nr:MAG: hypothetical protein JSW08_03880 [archaeon]
MTEEKKKPEKVEKKEQIKEKKEIKPETEKKTETKPVEKKEEKPKPTSEEKPAEEKKEEKKPEPKKIPPKGERKASVHFKNIPISTKHSIAICRFIKHKNPQECITLLEKVIAKRLPIPMKGEIPHRKHKVKGKPAGRYPVKASRYFIKALKNLIGNAKFKLLAVDKMYITLAKANLANRPRRGTRLAYGPKQFKRTHFIIEAKEK